MVRTLGSVFVVGLFTLAGCDVGGGGGGDDDQTTPDAAEPSILCTATVTLAGTFNAPAVLDPAAGCQPQGTWAVTATIADRGTCATVPLRASYNYILSGTGRGTQITYSKASGEEFQGSVIASGSGGCKGSFEHILADGTNFQLLTLSPALPTLTAATSTLTITGSGDFELWKRHP